MRKLAIASLLLLLASPAGAQADDGQIIGGCLIGYGQVVADLQQMRDELKDEHVVAIQALDTAARWIKEDAGKNCARAPEIFRRVEASK